MEAPETYLEEGQRLLQFASERCRGCEEALQGACEVARFAIEHGIDPDAAGQRFSDLMARCKGRNYREASHIPPSLDSSCSFPTNGVESAVESIVSDFKFLHEVLPKP